MAGSSSFSLSLSCGGKQLKHSSFFFNEQIIIITVTNTFQTTVKRRIIKTSRGKKRHCIHWKEWIKKRHHFLTIVLGHPKWDWRQWDWSQRKNSSHTFLLLLARYCQWKRNESMHDNEDNSCVCKAYACNKFFKLLKISSSSRVLTRGGKKT